MGVGQTDTVAQHLAHGVVAGGPGEDEDDRRQHVVAVELVDHLGAQRRPDGKARTPPPRLVVADPAVQGPAHHLVDPLALASRFAVGVEQGQQLRLLVLAPVHGEVVAQLDRPLPFDDDRRVAAHRSQPSTELVGIVDGGGQADEADLGGREHEDLLPHATPIRVLEEVHLVEDHRVQGLEQIRTGQEHVAQDLGRHDDHRSPGPDRAVAGQQPDVLLAVGGYELGELLVRKRLEGCRVEGLAPGGQGAMHRVGSHQRLPRSGRGGDEDGLVGIEAAQGVQLEVVEDEGEAGLELRQAARLDGPPEGGQRPSSFPIPMETK